MSDERTAGRIIQLLPSIHASPAALTNDDEAVNDPAAKAKVFEDEEVQTLWVRAVLADKDWRLQEMQSTRKNVDSILI